MGNTQKLREIYVTPEVLDAINGELAYQTKLPGSGRADAVDHGVAGQLVTLKVYTDKALVAWTNTPGDERALHELRKVAAIAIRALVLYGCPERPKCIATIGRRFSNGDSEHEFVYSDHPLAAKIVACKTVADVVQLTSDKDIVTVETKDGYLDRGH